MDSRLGTLGRILLVCCGMVNASVGVLDINHLLQLPLHESDPESHGSNALDGNALPPHPWSHHPHCTPSTHPASPSRFCVYTTNTTGPYGLSIITTPTAASSLPADLNTSPLSSFLTHSEASTLYASPAPWAVVDIPGKDKGVVAMRKIHKYETFMVDQAALVVDMRVDEAVSKGVRRELLKIGIERLRTPGTVREMSARHAEAVGEGEEGSVDEDVLATNAFGSTVAGVGTHALFPLISRINHACDPNSFVLFARAGISMAIRAYRDIEEGEEITISYLPLGLPHKKRTESIARWGFTCTCSLCSLPDRERKASDLRRLMIAQSEEKVIELAQDYQVATAINLALDAVDLTKDEGLESMLTDEYAMLAMLYLESGDKVKAEEYGRKAWNLLADLGYLGAKDSRGAFSLKGLLDGIEKMGGRGRAWKAMERDRGGR